MDDSQKRSTRVGVGEGVLGGFPVSSVLLPPTAQEVLFNTCVRMCSFACLV